MSHAAIERIYQTIEDPDVWPEALQSVADATNSVGALIMMMLPNRARLAIPSPQLAEAASDYIENWATKDIRSNRLEDRKLLLSHDTITDEDVVTPTEMDTEPFYTVFLKKHGLRYFCASTWLPMQQSFMGLSLQRSDAQGAYCPSDRQTVFMFGKHIERAMRLRGRLVQEETRRETLENVVSAQQLAVILTDIEGRVGFLNEAARCLPKDIFSVAGERLRFGSPAQSAQILEIVRQVDSGNVQAVTRTVFLSSSEGGPGYALNVLRRPRPRAEKAPFDVPGVGQVIIVLTPVRLEHEFDVAVTRDFLRLSLGEARVAALIASGRSPREVAQKLGLTLETVRFIVKQVFRKTGFRRQSELAAALNALRALPLEAAQIR